MSLALNPLMAQSSDKELSAYQKDPYNARLFYEGVNPDGQRVQVPVPHGYMNFYWGSWQRLYFAYADYYSTITQDVLDYCEQCSDRLAAHGIFRACTNFIRYPAP